MEPSVVILLDDEDSEEVIDEKLAEKLQKESDYQYALDLAKMQSQPIPKTVIESNHDPFVDVFALFRHYNISYFSSKLDSVVLQWSNRMTLCAGLCVYTSTNGACTIKLSEPLLKFRPNTDVINTLIHEMIHAYLFMIKCNDNHNDHGVEFTKKMNEINQKEGTNITVFHNFNDEVEFYRTHWWKCDKCNNIIKRSINRAPNKYDNGWYDHLRECGGNYIKIKEPEDYAEKKKNRGKKRKRDDSETPSPVSYTHLTLPTTPYV
eukprot:TRINITY_DN14351_c0_g1_i2.p1 TRINITY_DN14351_c0_g1~~TRINITY_DN14351_c0_g1_i2.p1  ORF type:complete len:263 (+),score=32.96 TRINITY_DN14351_c0_g1_i2:112-900(+)